MIKAKTIGLTLYYLAIAGSIIVLIDIISFNWQTVLAGKGISLLSFYGYIFYGAICGQFLAAAMKL